MYQFRCFHFFSYNVSGIGGFAFSGCSDLRRLVIPDGVADIGEAAFAHCYALKSVSVPDGVTGIGDRAFACCRVLTSITIGDGITAIGAYALYNCESLADICYNGTEDQRNNVEKGKGRDEDTGGYTVHCTDGDIPKR